MSKKEKKELINNIVNCKIFLSTKIHLRGGCGDSIIIEMNDIDEYELTITRENFKTTYNNYLTREELIILRDNLNTFLETTNLENII